jgi:hypothetical protein
VVLIPSGHPFPESGESPSAYRSRFGSQIIRNYRLPCRTRPVRSQWRRLVPRNAPGPRCKRLSPARPTCAATARPLFGSAPRPGATHERVFAERVRHRGPRRDWPRKRRFAGRKSARSGYAGADQRDAARRFMSRSGGARWGERGAALRRAGNAVSAAALAGGQRAALPYAREARLRARAPRGGPLLLKRSRRRACATATRAGMDRGSGAPGRASGRAGQNAVSAAALARGHHAVCPTCARRDCGR